MFDLFIIICASSIIRRIALAILWQQSAAAVLSVDLDQLQIPFADLSREWRLQSHNHESALMEFFDLTRWSWKQDLPLTYRQLQLQKNQNIDKSAGAGGS